jgi:anti-anti-sigma regulatory factor
MLNWRISPRAGDETLVMVYGEITEATSFRDLLALRGSATLDLAGVRRLNSFGVRELVDFLDTLGSHCLLAAERCSPAVVTQLNLLPELTRHLAIRSVMAPMECPACFHEREVLVDVRGGRHAVPKTPCDECEAPMELAEPEERYFAFLSGL